MRSSLHLPSSRLTSRSALSALPVPLVPLVLGALLAGCRLPGSSDVPRRIEPAQAPHQVELAEDEISAGRARTAVERLLVVREIENLDPDLRLRTDELLAQAVEGILRPPAGDPAGAAEEPPDADELLELFELDLPTRLRARAGVQAAEEQLARGRPIAAFRTIQRVDRELAGHPARAQAGRVVGRAGLALIEDPRRYNLIFRYESRGAEALEYLVTRYPLDPRCPAAYAALAEHYERHGDLDLAVERREDLLVYHPESPETVESEARLPELRLARLGRDDYDRGELERARDEVQRWLERHAGHPLEPRVRDTARAVEERLASSDLLLARFYDRIASGFGARIHAERALASAERAESEVLAAEARALLAALPSGGEDESEAAAESPTPTIDEIETFEEGP